MANVYCVFLKFCVFCLIFVELSQSNQIDHDQFYRYTVENSQSPKDVRYYVRLISSRAKRDTNEPQLPSVTINVTSTSWPTTAAAAVKTVPSTPPAKDGADLKAENMTPIDSTQHLLGVDGAGQRKYYPSTNNNNITKAILTDISPTIANLNKTSTVNKNFPATVAAPSTKATAETEATETEATLSEIDEDVIGHVDEPDDTFNKTISDEIKNITQKVDYFQYYNSTTIVDKNKTDEYWNTERKNFIISNILSKSHRRAITVQLNFDFPFYGHLVRNVTIATGGFLYTGEYVHSWLAATQYIAPLMANFDTSMSNVSTVKYSDNGTAFTVIWDKVPLQDGTPSKSPLFSFCATLYNTGDITFVYKEIPILIENIKDEKHPVKIGLSDAYIIDKTIYFARRKTIYEYHRVNFNGQDIKNNTIIMLKALPTCLEFKDCGSCLNAKLQAFNCTWCPALNRCSTGTDRKRQHWVQHGCEHTQLKDSNTCPPLGSKGNNYSAQQPIITPATNMSKSQNPNVDGNSGAEVTESKNKASSYGLMMKLPHIDSNQSSKYSHASFAVGILLPLIVIASLIMWAFYAYRNPHTKSGQLLIQYRPSQWTWRRGEARYTAATIHM